MLRCRWAKITLFSLFCVSAHLHAQSWSGIIDPSRAFDSRNAGIPGGIPTRTTICVTLTSSATAAQINSAIATCPSGQVVFLSAGTYNLSAMIDFTGHGNVTLRGAGPDQTILRFTSNAPGNCAQPADVCIEGSSNWSGGPENTTTWTAGYAQGATQITLGSTANLSLGQLLILDQDNDTADTNQVFVCDNIVGEGSVTCATDNTDPNSSPGRECSNAGTVSGCTSAETMDRNQQQYVTVTAIQGNVVTIAPGLYMPNWRSSQNSGAWWATATINSSGIEDLTLDHTASASNMISGLMFFNAYECWQKNVRSIIGNRNHIFVQYSARVVIRDSYFWGTLNSTGLSYGVEPWQSGDLLVENNIFQHVSSPILIGASEGSVYGYNFLVDDFNNDPNFMFPAVLSHDTGGDMVLIEGNQGPAFLQDAIHGTHNFATVFRNRFTGLEPGKSTQTNPVFLESHSRYANIIGNVLGTAGYHTVYQNAEPTINSCETGIFNLGWSASDCSAAPPVPLDGLVAGTLMRWGNYDTVNGAVQWNSSEVPTGLSQFANAVPASHNLPASFYLSATPSWWGTMPYPAIGPDVSEYSYGNPAQLCYDNSPIDGNYGSNNVLLFNADNCSLLAGRYSQAQPPRNVTATATSASQINLSWTASTSNVGLANYVVQRCQGAGCTNFAQIAVPIGTTYSDTGLSASTSYSYRVQAIDTAGNLSLFSNLASAATQTPPTAPSNVTATATSKSQINLSWTASTSSVGLANYVVQRCQGAGCTNFAQIAAPAGTTYSDTGLSASTSYSYRVQAIDTAGNPSSFSNLASAATRVTAGDFDGDGKADTVVFRPSSGTWFIIPSSNPSAPIVQQWGTQGDIPVPGDYDGDGKTDIAVFRPSSGTWFIIPSSTPGSPLIQQWGTQGDIPVPGDYDGDGKTDIAVFRPSNPDSTPNGTWFIIPSSNPSAPIVQQWGTLGDIPAPADYDGDGKTDIAVFRPSSGTWFIIPSSTPGSPLIQQWGTQGDIPVPGDYDGDGKTDIAVFRPSNPDSTPNGTWFIIPSNNPGSPLIQQWGTLGDIPVPADYDGNGKSDIAVWRPSSGTWFIIPSTNPSTFTMTQWGISTDTPVQ